MNFLENLYVLLYCMNTHVTSFSIFSTTVNFTFTKLSGNGLLGIQFTFYFFGNDISKNLMAVIFPQT